VIQAQREEGDACLSTEVTLDVELPPTEVLESEVVLQPTVRRIREGALLDQGAATLVFEGHPADVAALQPGDLIVLQAPGEKGADQVRQVSEIRILEGPQCPPSLHRLMEERTEPRSGEAATLLSTTPPSPKEVFKSIRHRSTFRFDLESLSREPGWEKLRRWLPSTISISSPLAKGRPGGLTFAFDGVHIFEWQGRTLSFSGAITLSGAIEHGTVVDMPGQKGYSEQKIAAHVAYQGAIVADFADFSWPREGGYQRLLPVPIPIVVPLGSATLTLYLFPFYLKAKGWMEGELAVDGEVDLDQVIRKDLATGTTTRSGPGLTWPVKGETSLAGEARIKLFLGFFPVEAALGFAGVEFAGFACPMGIRGSLAGHFQGPLGAPPTPDACASLNWDTELLFYLRFPSSFLSWFFPSSWGFHKFTLAFHTRRISSWNKDCLDDWDGSGHRHPENSGMSFLAPPRTQSLLGGAWLEGKVGEPVSLRAPWGAGSGPWAWSQVDGPGPVPILDPSGPEFTFTPTRPGRYSFQVQGGEGDLQSRFVDVRVLGASPDRDQEAP
jgi:hypothetical protein